MKTFLLIFCLTFTLALRAEESPRHPHETHGEKGHADEPGEHSAHGKEEEETHEEGEEHGEEGHEEEGEGISSNVGPGNAVTAADPKRGLQLSEEAVKTLGIKTQPAPSESFVPKSAIVTFKDETGVYRLRDGWYKLVEGYTQPQNNRLRFTPHEKQDLRPGDKIVVEGAPLLRVAELDAFSGGEAGHGH